MGSEELAKSDKRSLPYPKAVFFIVGNEFCERFSYYGMKAILSIYFQSKLHFGEDVATVVYHTFTCLCYFTPIFGALIADQILGKFKTIFYISILYVFGHLIKTLATIPMLSLPPVEFSLIGLLLIAIGTGGIKPCVSAFGGDQFQIPGQELQLATFFSVFYFAINSGSLLSVFITPILRQDVSCFGDDTCYSLAFGVPALLMLIATIIFVFGKPKYKINPPQGNVLTKFISSVFYALKIKVTKSSKVDYKHWMDASAEKYGHKLIQDVKIVLQVLILYLPLPIFWALFDQQGSRWTFQATRMNGDCNGYTIKPDQMQLFNPALILFLIPLFDKIIYPVCAKINFLKTPLQRIGVGGILVAVSFIISGILELSLMRTYEHVPVAGESHLHIMNGLPCSVTLNDEEIIQSYESLKKYELKPVKYNVTLLAHENCQFSGERQQNILVDLKDEEVTSFLLLPFHNHFIVQGLRFPEIPKKASEGYNNIKSVYYNISSNSTLQFIQRTFNMSLEGIPASDLLQESNYTKIGPGTYLLVSGQNEFNLELKQGGVHTLLVTQNKITDFVLTQENSIHMLWLVPQYFVITVGEIMFSIPGLEFSYSQAPISMKSVVQAAWLLTTAFGNVIVIIIAGAKAFENQASEFFMFAALMIIDIFIFSYLAYRYKYVNDKENELNELKSEDNSNL